jgi:hypothetical protein
MHEVVVIFIHFNFLTIKKAPPTRVGRAIEEDIVIKALNSFCDKSLVKKMGLLYVNEVKNSIVPTYC